VSPRIIGASSLCVGLLLVAALVGMPVLSAAETAPAPRKIIPRGESYDLLYLSDVRPVVVRLYITFDGKSLQEGWNRFADTLFAKLDADKSGTVDGKELAHLQPILSLLAGQVNRIPTDRSSVTRPMNRAEFGEYLKKNDLGPVRLQSSINPQRFNRGGIRRMGSPTHEELDKVLLELLDTNKDGKISVAEFTAGIEILSKLDADENELITTEEILRRPQLPYFVQDFDGNMQEAPSPGVELIPLMRKGTDSNLAKRILIRYGPKPPGNQNPNQMRNGRFPQQVAQQTEPTVRRLSKKELKLSDAIFEALDQDGDDELDMEELSRFGQNAQPEIEIAIRLGKLAGGSKPAEVILDGNSPLKVFASPSGAEVAIEVPGVRLDFMSHSVYGGSPKPKLRATYLERFHELDRDANGYLDMNKVAGDQLFRDLFTLFDKDGDGKIFEKELLAVVDDLEEVASAAANGMVLIDLNEASRGLFGLIDADGDGKLSIPELRAMAKLVERYGSAKDGTLTPRDIPRRFEASLSLGISASQRTYAPQNPYMYGQNVPPRPQVGPMWFQKMDRNRDGYVSRREFLGTDEEFRKLDLNGDGLISVEEAEAAEKK